jgi:hypothetical protein
MVEEPSPVKQLSLKHVCKIGLKKKYLLSASDPASSRGVERPGVINPSGREEGARNEKTIHFIVQLSTYTVYGNYFEQKFTLQSLISKIIFPARKG